VSRQRPILPWLSLGIVYLVWSSTYLAIRYVVLEVPPVTAAAVRFSCAGVVMAVLAALTERRHGWPSLRQVLQYAFAGVLLLGVCNTGAFWVEQYLDSGLTALLGATLPLWMIGLDALRPGGRRLTGRTILGCLLGVGGVLVVVMRPGEGLRAGQLFWALVCQGCIVAWVVGSLYAKSIPKRLPVFTSSAIEMLVSGALLFVVARVIGEPTDRLAAASSHAWAGLAFLIVFGSVIAFTAYVHCNNELPANIVGTYPYVNIVLAVLLGHVFAGEPVSASLLVGGVVIFGAVLLCSSQPQAAPNPEEAPAAAPDAEAS
jgi:drug/metabolite transporter (DMT)-like permease